jgi:predicted alpha/beta-hydrolase family hydrolase
MIPEEFKIPVHEYPDGLSARWYNPENAYAQVLMTHGAGAPMEHPFMSTSANLMAERGLAVLQYNFLYIQLGSKRPDHQKKTVSTIIQAIEFQKKLSDLPLFVGGKSYGGRMSSWAMAENNELAVSGLIYWGFPLHAPGRPSSDRAGHLAGINIPMLFLQGTRDTLADLSLLKPVVKNTKSGELFIVEEGDHSFKVPKRTGKTNDEILVDLADKVEDWTKSIVADQTS